MLRRTVRRGIPRFDLRPWAVRRWAREYTALNPRNNFPLISPSPVAIDRTWISAIASLLVTRWLWQRATLPDFSLARTDDSDRAGAGTRSMGTAFERRYVHTGILALEPHAMLSLSLFPSPSYPLDLLTLSLSVSLVCQHVSDAHDE